MAESMKDYETELEVSFKKTEEGDILTGTVISVEKRSCGRSEVLCGRHYSGRGLQQRTGIFFKGTGECGR